MKQFFKLSVYICSCLGMAVYAQGVGDYTGKIGVNTEMPKATLEIQKSLGTSTNEGIIIPNLSKERIEEISTNVESTIVFSLNGSKNDTNLKTKEITTKGFYYYDGDNSTGKWVRMIPKAQFYMPSIVLDVTEGTKTVDLYAKYKEQYGTGVVSSNASSKLRVFDKDDLDYFVTYSDTSVFENIGISNSGVLTYTVTAGAVVTENTYINVVLQEK